MVKGGKTMRQEAGVVPVETQRVWNEGYVVVVLDRRPQL